MCLSNTSWRLCKAAAGLSPEYWYCRTYAAVFPCSLLSPLYGRKTNWFLSPGSGGVARLCLSCDCKGQPVVIDDGPSLLLYCICPLLWSLVICVDAPMVWDVIQILFYLKVPLINSESLQRLTFLLEWENATHKLHELIIIYIHTFSITMNTQCSWIYSPTHPKYSLQPQMWINLRLKILPNKFTLSFSLGNVC